MSAFRWKARAKRAREASVREQEQLLESLAGEEETLPPSELRVFRQVDSGVVAPNNVAAYPFRFGSDPFPYYRFTPYFFGGGGGEAPAPVPPQGQPSTRVMTAQPSARSVAGKKTQGTSTKTVKKGNATHKHVPSFAGTQDGRVADGSYPPNAYGYYPHPVQYQYPGAYGYPAQQTYPYPQYPQHQYPQYQGGMMSGYPGGVAPQGVPPAPEPSESEDETTTMKSGVMSVEGRRPLFLVALFVVSIAVLLVSFPLTLLAAGYIGPLGLMFATGPFATVFAFWAIYLTPCECFPNIEWATSRIRVFATTAAVFDAVGTIGVPISMYGAQCPDDDDQMLGCEDELPAAKGLSLAVAVVLGTHCFLCLLVRSNARKLAESKFGDDRTEGITLTPTPFDRS